MIDNDLIAYLENNIIPLYNKLDGAHQSDHVYKVILQSLEIAKDYKVNLNMIYTIAVFHDLGLLVDRKNHHIIGGAMLESDSYIKEYFNNDEIKIMKEAVEDHRASNKNMPRSIYGAIIGEADRNSDVENIIRRCFLFDIDKYGISNFNNSYQRVKLHVIEKYGKDGYLQVWLSTKKVTDALKKIENMLKDNDIFENYCYQIYQEIIKE